MEKPRAGKTVHSIVTKRCHPLGNLSPRHRFGSAEFNLKIRLVLKSVCILQVVLKLLLGSVERRRHFALKFNQCSRVCLKELDYVFYFREILGTKMFHY